MGVWDSTMYALDTPGSLLRGLLSGKPGTRRAGREMLESWGALGPNREGLDAGDVAGFLADVVLDPVNLLGGWGAAKGLKAAAKAAKAYQAGRGVKAVAAARKASAELAPRMASLAPQGGLPSSVAGTVSDLRAARKASLREGMTWTGKHYEKKLAASGGENVVNPRSGLKLWADPARGKADLEDLLTGRVRVVEEPTVVPANAMYSSGAVINKAGIPDEAGRFPLHTFVDPDTGKTHIRRSTERRIELAPTTVNSPTGIASSGVHEGMHYLNDVTNLAPATHRHIQKTTQAAERMWKRRGVDITANLPEAPGKEMLDRLAYFTNPDEVMARVAETRRAMGKHGLQTIPHAGRIKGVGWSDQLGNIPVDRDWSSLEQLNQVYGPRLLNHLLRVLPAVPLAAALGVGASSQR